MSNYLTKEIITDLNKFCVSYLKASIGSRDDSNSLARNIDGSILIDKLVWAITLPFFLGIASNYAFDTIKNITNKRKNITDAKEKMEELIGNEINLTKLTESEEIITLIKENANKIGIHEEQIDDLLRLMANSINIKDDHQE